MMNRPVIRRPPRESPLRAISVGPESELVEHVRRNSQLNREQQKRLKLQFTRENRRADPSCAATSRLFKGAAYLRLSQTLGHR